MKIRVTTDKYEYQGLFKGSEHYATCLTDNDTAVIESVVFPSRGKFWTLRREDFELVGEEVRPDYNPLDVQHGGTHYKSKSIQPIEYILANNLGFCEGNIVKYISRWKEKNGKEDVIKAKHYCEFLIAQIEKEEKTSV